MAQLINQTENVFVVIFLRGACDGLNFVAPTSGEDRKIYELERPNIKMALEGQEALLPLNQKFGIHPKAQAFHQLYKTKKMAVIHAAGSSLKSRSHFDAQNMMELGLVQYRTLGEGWQTRFLNSNSFRRNAVHLGSETLPAIAAGPFLPTSLLGFEQAISVNDLNRVYLIGNKNLHIPQQEILLSMYEAGDTFLHRAGKEALKSLQRIQKATEAVMSENSQPNGHANGGGSAANSNKVGGSEGEKKGFNEGVKDYPKNEIGNRLKTVSRLLKLKLGTQMINVDMGGWDTHKYQGTGVEGAFAKQVEQLSEAVGFFVNDISNAAETKQIKLTVLVMSEFGRRLRENANRGTDHGHGGVFFVIGDGVNGGQMYGAWPGLATENLFERADLAVMTDYRQVVAEILDRKFNCSEISKVFPDYHLPNFKNRLHFMS